MKLTLKRTRGTPVVTLGSLYVDGVFECFTLEDTVRVDDPLTPQDEGKKVMGMTAIPAGTYQLIINESPRFKRNLMRLLDVPGFTGILIHGGNTAEDTHGCILVGNSIENGTIKRGTSTPALKALQAKVQKALDAGSKVEITVVNSFAGAV